jgi:hypothetical protein
MAVPTDRLLEMTGAGPAVILGTRDARLRPAIVRAWGIQVWLEHACLSAVWSTPSTTDGS